MLFIAVAMPEPVLQTEIIREHQRVSHETRLIRLEVDNHSKLTLFLLRRMGGSKFTEFKSRVQCHIAIGFVQELQGVPRGCRYGSIGAPEYRVKHFGSKAKIEPVARTPRCSFAPPTNGLRRGTECRLWWRFVVI